MISSDITTDHSGTPPGATYHNHLMMMTVWCVIWGKLGALMTWCQLLQWSSCLEVWTPLLTPSSSLSTCSAITWRPRRSYSIASRPATWWTTDTWMMWSRRAWGWCLCLLQISGEKLKIRSLVNFNSPIVPDNSSPLWHSRLTLRSMSVMQE